MKSDNVARGFGAFPVIQPNDLMSLLTATADLVLLLSKEGQVLTLGVGDGLSDAEMFQDWVGDALFDHLTVESWPKLQNILSGSGKQVDGIELNHTLASGDQLAMRYTARPAANDGVFLLLGTDLGPVATVQQQLVKAQFELERQHEARRSFDVWYRSAMAMSSSALVFVSAEDGRVQDANAAAVALFGETGTGADFAAAFSRDGAAQVRTALADKQPATFSAVLTNSGDGVEVSVRPVRADGQVTLLFRIDAADETGLPYRALRTF